MSSVSISALFVLPVLFLISIPLILSATITICFSILALFIRLSIISIELCYALIVSYFVIPTTTSTSLLNFAASDPTTPRSKSPSFPQSDSPSHTNSISSDPPQHAQGPYRSPRRGKPHRHTGPPFVALLGLISGDEGRDFEGLGGWRCPAPSKQPRQSSASAPSSITNGIDERAWLSINNRLELPSQSDPLLGPIPASPGAPHHRRSVTTSMLTPTPPPRGGKRGRAIAAFEPCSPATTDPLPTEESGVGSYFALRRPTSSSGAHASGTTPTAISDDADRVPSASSGRLMAHYPAAVRFRRRSISGSARILLNGLE